MSERQGTIWNALIVSGWYVLGMGLLVMHARVFGVGFGIVAALVVHVVAVAVMAYWFRGKSHE